MTTQPYRQLWRQWTTQRRLGASAAFSLTIALVCVPWALTKARSFDKLLVIGVGFAALESTRRSAFGYFDHRDTDADLTYAEKREMIQQHNTYLKQEQEPMLIEEAKEDEMITDVVRYWESQDKHLLIIGGTGSGKTTFVKSFSQQLRGYTKVVYDCDATKDDWQWADEVYHEFPEIEQRMAEDLSVITEIRKARYSEGNNWKPQPTLMIADEFPALISELKNPKKWLSTHAKQTRKHKRMIAILSQNDTISNLGLKGDVSVRDTCFTLVYLGSKAIERAKALGREDWVQKLTGSYKYAIVDDKLAIRPT